MVKYSTEKSKDDILGSLWKYLWKEVIDIIKMKIKAEYKTYATFKFIIFLFKNFFSRQINYWLFYFSQTALQKSTGMVVQCEECIVVQCEECGQGFHKHLTEDSNCTIRDFYCILLVCTQHPISFLSFYVFLFYRSGKTKIHISHSPLKLWFWVWTWFFQAYIHLCYLEVKQRPFPCFFWLFTKMKM